MEKKKDDLAWKWYRQSYYDLCSDRKRAIDQVIKAKK